jgi:hypothetical protein
MRSPGQQDGFVKNLSCWFTFFGLLASACAVPAQDSKPPDPAALVRSVVANEVAAAQNNSVKFMFRSRRTTQKGVQNRIYAQANETVATLAIGQSDQPLAPQQERAQLEQLAQLARSPDRLHRKQERDKQDLDRTLRILKALPDAFCFQYAGTEPGDSALGKPGAQLIRLDFKPNPSYSPPSSVEQVLTGMEGTVLIDPAARRLARIDGRMFREVNFGWGIFGRLDPGGTFRVQQADAGDGNWAVTQMTLKLTGKILLLKTLNIISDETFEGFQRLPDNLPFAKAVELLEKQQQTKLAQIIPPPQAAIAVAAAER